MDVHQFLELSKNFSAIPIYRRLMADTVTPVSLFLKIRHSGRYPMLLESVEGGENLARYSFIAANPFELIRLENDQVIMEDSTGLRQASEEDFFDLLRRKTSAYREPDVPDLPRFSGGAIGFSSYDTFRKTEFLPNVPDDDLKLPDAIWAFYDEVFAFDHVKHQIILIKTVRLNELDSDLERRYKQAQLALDRMESVLKQDILSHEPFELSPAPLKSNVDKAEFMWGVEKAKAYIYEGDIFQVVLSQRFEQGVSGDRFMLYRALRTVNPSPYLFYLDFDAFALIGSSPEVLVRVVDGRATVWPIAGTRPRGTTPEEDKALEADLMADPKERSEHVMLVDLGRNDLSRVCEAGSVEVTQSQVVVRYSHVMHIVSQVEGNLAKGKSAVDALRYCFPAGTVSGAPKIRAMEIIDELETTKRGPYAGSVGYFDFSGNMDTCIAIRTMVAKDKQVFIQAGAGIVADSVPENEYHETVNKAKALVTALSLATKINEQIYS